jgi:hypothetical protein
MVGRMRAEVNLSASAGPSRERSQLLIYRFMFGPAPQGAVVLGSVFVLGMIVTHALLGLVVGLAGGWIQRFICREWGLVLGPASIVILPRLSCC